MATSVALQGLAGIYDPRASFEAGSARAALLPALGGWTEVLANGPLAVAWTPPQAGYGSSGNVLCVLDGHIYNIDAVARDLGVSLELGPEEVLSAGYERWESTILERIRGSFTVVLWDRERKRGLIAQDQFGTRSLYTCTPGDRLFFASEVAPLLRMLPTRPAPDTVALIHWIGSLHLPTDGATLFEGIRRVGAGRFVEIAEGRWERRSYWFPHYEAPLPMTRAEAADALWEALSRAVRVRASHGETIGVLMSGGVDSSAVAAAAAEAVDGRGLLRGYSAVFPDDPQIDESEKVDALARHLGLPSVKIHIRPQGAFALSLDYLQTWELPVGGPGYLIEQPLLEQAAKDGVRVVFDGQGGDEVFGFAPYLAADRLRKGRLVASRRTLRLYPGAERRSPDSYRRMWRAYAVNGAVPYAIHTAVRRARGPGRHAPRWLSPESARVYFDNHDPWAWKKRRGVPRWWAQHAYLVTRAREDYGGSDYFRRRAAMARLEARPPIMDVDLVEVALSIPPELYLDPRLDRPLIRQSLEGRVPDAVRLHDRKSNLLSFYHEGLTGPDLAPLRRLLGRSDAEVAAYANPEVVRDLLDNPPVVGGPAWFTWVSAIWGLVTAECWLRHQADEGFLERLREAPDVPRPRWEVTSAPAAN